jgi:hypothetical protein
MHKDDVHIACAPYTLLNWYWAAAAGRRINERSEGLASHCIATKSDDEASSDSDDGAVSNQ